MIRKPGRGLGRGGVGFTVGGCLFQPQVAGNGGFPDMIGLQSRNILARH